jgi:hypothetical protein
MLRSASATWADSWEDRPVWAALGNGLLFSRSRIAQCIANALSRQQCAVRRVSFGRRALCSDQFATERSEPAQGQHDTFTDVFGPRPCQGRREPQLSATSSSCSTPRAPPSGAPNFSRVLNGIFYILWTGCAIPWHVGMVPGEPSEAPAIRRQPRRGNEVVSIGDDVATKGARL